MSCKCKNGSAKMDIDLIFNKMDIIFGQMERALDCMDKRLAKMDYVNPMESLGEKCKKQKRDSKGRFLSFTSKR